MNHFVQLIHSLDNTTSTTQKIEAISHYFLNNNPEDCVWALFYLSGRRMKKHISSRKLSQWYLEDSKLAPWLYEECYANVGDTAETISLLVRNDNNKKLEGTLFEWVGKIKNANDASFKEWWKEYDASSLFILHKLATGALRVGASKILTIKGLSIALNIPYEKISERLIGEWEPTVEFYENIKNPSLGKGLLPYPFFLANPIDDKTKEGSIDQWQLEWKWDGIRAMAVIRNQEKGLWSRGQELISDSFPDLIKDLPNKDAVIDGEIIPVQEGKVLPFFELQKRLNRKKISPKLLKEIPVIFLAYDLLELDQVDLRGKPLSERRKLLEEYPIQASPLLTFNDWKDIDSYLDQAEKENREGLMLKRKDSAYLEGRKTGYWWKIKLKPKSIDAVLMYAEPGTGKRSGLYTDYTFGVWQENELVPIAKAYSGLTNEEISRLDKWIRKNTTEKFGPVRKVKSELVFEIAYESKQISKRHKAGIALRFPRILRARPDKRAEEADQLSSLKEN